MKITQADTKRTLTTASGEYAYYSLDALKEMGLSSIDSAPYSLKILIEAVLRQIDGFAVKTDHLESFNRWKELPGSEIPFKPARVVMQDFTGVPGIVDLAAMRDALASLGGDPKQINPLIPVDLVIDHSIQVDRYGTADALDYNGKKEFERNRERYEFLHWASGSFDKFTVVPPAIGIVHQVNLEYLAKLVQTSESDGETVVFPDTLVGTDSHTTMINGIGVVGWGVGGIEAEAALLGQPLYIKLPEVIGVRISGEPSNNVTATDIVLHVTEKLRAYGVVEKIVEFFGPGLDLLTLPDRATISNMCPEYGATAAMFPVDSITLDYLRESGRSDDLIDLVEQYYKAQGLFRTPDSAPPEYTTVIDFDLASVVPSLAGPKRPQDRYSLSDTRGSFTSFLNDYRAGAERTATITTADGSNVELSDGSVVIAAITSCTNTSNPFVMIASGQLARNAVKKGLTVPWHVKTSFSPGSRVVTGYMQKAGLEEYLEQLGFYQVGYGCTSCIGNSGPLHPDVSKAIKANDLVAAGVLSGNRNFEGRIHQEVRANYLASPPLVVAYALAGTVDIDLDSDPLGKDSDGNDVYLKDIWPDPEETRKMVADSVGPDLFNKEYAGVYTANPAWNNVVSGSSERYGWNADSTYIKRPPFFEGLTMDVTPPPPVKSARVLAHLGDSVTTDHISPAGGIAPESPAALWLTGQDVQPQDFNSFGSRRGNHEVMMRGTLANIRIKNKLADGKEGGYTTYLPANEPLSMFDAAEKYREDGTPLIILAGKDYGMGSSRDWAAKGVALLGVKAVIAESYERIHRSNLIGMGVLPLQYPAGVTADSLGLTGMEEFTIDPVTGVGQTVTVKTSGSQDIEFQAIVRIDTDVELDYYRNGGILHTVLRQMAGAGA